jgi:hypothetical protein
MRERKAPHERGIRDEDGGATADLAVSNKTAPMDRFKSLVQRLLRVSREELRAEQQKDYTNRPASRRLRQREP